MKRIFLALLAMAALSSHGTVTPLPGVTPQRAPALSPFPVPLAVQVRDDAGRVVPGAVAYFSQAGGLQLAAGAAGDCWIDFMIVFVCRAVADADGIARFPAIVGHHAGTFAAMVQATNDLYPGTVRYGDATIELTADLLQVPARLSVAVGNDQRVVIGTTLAPVSVRLETPSGQPVSNATVYYSPITMGPGGFMPPLNGPSSVTTDAAGMAALPPLVAGWGIGSLSAEVRYFDEAARAWVVSAITYSTTNAQGGTTLDFGALWWAGAAENGWGLSVVQHGSQQFNVFYVYDEFGRPTWYVQPGGAWSDGLGGRFSGPIYQPHGAPWYAYDATKLQVGSPVGEANLYFRGPESAWAAVTRYRGTTYVNTQKDVVRQAFGRGTAAPISGVADLWWGGAAQNGWGLAIAEQQGTLFMVWFTYDGAGSATWFVMPGGEWTDARTYSGTVYRTKGAAWDGVPYDASKLQVGAVGTYSLRFDSTQQARMAFTVDGRSGVLDLVRQPF